MELVFCLHRHNKKIYSEAHACANALANMGCESSPMTQPPVQLQ